MIIQALGLHRFFIFSDSGGVKESKQSDVNSLDLRLIR